MWRGEGGGEECVGVHMVEAVRKVLLLGFLDEQ
jgi:hypothetical protein